MNFEMMQASIQQEKAEKYALLMPQLKEAVKNQDWEEMETLLTLSPDIMAEGLEYAYPYLPDEYKFRIPTDCYTQNGDHMPIVRKYVRQARKYAPIEKRIPAEMIPMKEITIYRAGIEPMDKAKYRISWTTSIEKAQWFYDRALHFGSPVCHLYRGVIRPEQIIWYTDDRNEKEVMQYGSVRDIEEIAR